MQETQTCTKCGEVKALEDFPEDPRKPLGKRTICKRCRAQAATNYKRRFPEKNRAAVARWQAKNIEKKRAISREWARRNRTRMLEQQQRRRHESPDQTHDIYLKSAYGVPYGTYGRLLAEQGGGCAICGTKKPGHGRKRFPLDHDHETGAIRGLLCGNCNSGIGYLQHDRAILTAAITYLDASSKSSGI